MKLMNDDINTTNHHTIVLVITSAKMVPIQRTGHSIGIHRLTQALILAFLIFYRRKNDRQKNAVFKRPHKYHQRRMEEY